MAILRAGDAHCRSQIGPSHLGTGVWGLQMSPWPALGCRAGHSFPHTALNSSQGWDQTLPHQPGFQTHFPNCNRASWEKCGVSGFPEGAAVTGAAIGVFPRGIWQRDPSNTQSMQKCWDLRSPCFSPSFSQYLSHTHGWVGSNLNQNLQISPKQGEFQQTRKLGLQPAVSPRVTQLIK